MNFYKGQFAHKVTPLIKIYFKKMEIWVYIFIFISTGILPVTLSKHNTEREKQHISIKNRPSERY